MLIALIFVKSIKVRRGWMLILYKVLYKCVSSSNSGQGSGQAGQSAECQVGAAVREE